MVRGCDLITEWLEKPVAELFPAAAEHNGDPCGERELNSDKLRAIFAVSRHRGIENARDSDTHEGRCHVGAVIHILIQHAAFARRSATSADEADGVNVEQ